MTVHVREEGAAGCWHATKEDARGGARLWGEPSQRQGWRGEKGQIGTRAATEGRVGVGSSS